jgi:hypothetical protein
VMGMQIEESSMMPAVRHTDKRQKTTKEYYIYGSRVI